jgi:hypothetical protein
MAETSKRKLVHESVRRGVPFTMYFSPEQAEALATACRNRRVSKATLVRYAVERLLEQIESGQLELPLGVEPVRNS